MRPGCGPLHLVSAWATANRLVLGQLATAEKSNEITAVPERLRSLELAGCIVTVDAKKIEAHFKDGVLSVKLPKTEEAKPKQIEVKVN
jgi:predicted transposase YbfD/YdcC